MNPQNKKLVIFDFDGVLVNTLEFCFNLHKNYNKDFTFDEVKDICKGNFVEGMNKMINEKNHFIPSDFYDKYDDEIKKFTIHDVLRETIQMLSLEYIIVIVSSTPTKSIKSFLVKENMEKYFSEILGSDVNFSKSYKIKSVLEKYNIKPKDAVFITDTLGDILEGNQCDVPSIGITWGLHDKESLKNGNPFAIINDPRNLLNTIKNVLK